MPIIENMDEQEYRKHPAVANSDLTTFRRSPAHLIARRNAPEKTTPAKLDGKALHTAILEPESFMARYCVLPADAPKDQRHHRGAAKPAPATLASIYWWDNWTASNGNRIILTAEDYDEKMRVADNVRNHPALKAYFDTPGQSEVSMFANDPETGTGCKARPDRIVTVGGYRVMLDPKSTDDARAEAFSRSAFTYSYFQQAAFYTDVAEWADSKIDLFLFIAFEKEAPYGIKVYEVSDDDLDFGRRQYRKALDAYAACLQSQEFPCYSTDIEVLTRPSWAKE